MRAAVLLLPLLLSGCRIFNIFYTSEHERLREKREQWQALGIQSYDYEHRKYCFCPPEINQLVRVEVRNGVVVRTVNVATGEEITSPYLTWPTIDQLFDETEQLFGTNYRLKIEYDAALYFPTKITGDVPRAIDDEFTTTAENLIRR